MTVQPTSTREQGAMLIVALAVLTLLALIAITFASLMRLERRATENFKNVRRAELVANSAEANIVALLRGGLFWDGFTTWSELKAPWIYGVKSGDSMLGNRLPLETAREEEVSYAWKVASTYPGGLDYFKTKIIDTASQININGPQDSLADMLDNLGDALKRDYRWGKNPMFARYPESGNRITGKRLIEFRAKLEGGVFASKTQLKEFIGERNFAILEDFITTHSWVDSSTYRGADGIPANRPQGATTAVGGSTNSNLRMEVTGSARVEPEDRAPINVNTAPEPVLIAALMGLGCRRPFPYVTVERQRTEERNRVIIDLGESGTLPATDEELKLRSEPLWVFSKPLNYERAKALADAIVKYRKSVHAFRAWQMPGNKSGGFEAFVNDLPDSVFPQPTEATAVNPRDKNQFTERYMSELLSPSSESGKVFTQGHANSGFRRSVGLPVSPRYAWYYDMMRGMLLANFNPNSRINKNNPNASAYQAVDKSNLIKLDESGVTRGTPRPGHTTEFCFDSGGVYEIVTFAQITAKESESTEGTSAEDGTNEEMLGQERFAYVKQRSIVKVFEVMRHTSQLDFEQPFSSHGFASYRDRKFVTTYPDPMDALVPDLHFGSQIDGRVEMTGHIDAIRQDQDPSVRMSIPGEKQANYLLTAGFRYRTPVSENRLRSMSRRNRGSKEFIEERAKIFYPDFARAGRGFEQPYSNTRWDTLGTDSEESELINDPLLEAINLGGDLNPDGLHSSMFSSSALGARCLVYPASKVRQNPDDQGAMGQANDSGNLPYYNGGIAFWVKLEFDGNYPVFCGLAKATQVMTEVGDSLDDSEGTQFYVWKNTSGELRVSRLYYHQAFRKGQPENAVPDIGDDGESESSQQSQIELDEKKKQARTDVIVDIKDWKANEWHHIAIEYNDDRLHDRIRVLVDFEEIGGLANDMGEGQFCALNEEEPKDGLFVGAFVRDQATADEGLFKFNTNLSPDGKQEIGESVKRILANATIDEFTTFTQTYSPPYGDTGYFTDKVGIYTNLFRIPVPEGIQRLRLRSFSWTAYYPKSYAGRPLSAREDDVRMSIAGVGTSTQQLLSLSDPGGGAADGENSNVSGRWMKSVPGFTNEDRVCDVVYQLRMRAARGSEKYGRFYVATPVLDDVTLTYYLPTAQVLLNESY